MTETHAAQARRWLERQVGFTEACARIQAEADALRISPISTTAVRQAVATYTTETGRRPYLTHTAPPPPEEQDQLL